MADKILGEVGEVVGKENNKIIVKLQRTEACAKCRACTAGMKKEDMLIKAENMCNASVGNKVDLVLDNADFMKATLIMYGIPFAAFMIGIFGGYYGALSMGMDNGEVIGIAAGVILVIISYLIIHTQEDKFKKGNFVPKAIKIVE